MRLPRLRLGVALIFGGLLLPFEFELLRRLSWHGTASIAVLLLMGVVSVTTLAAMWPERSDRAWLRHRRRLRVAKLRGRPPAERCTKTQ